MRIHRLSLLDGAREARGIAVIIDVFRAFSCEPFMFHFGARRIVLERDVERCFRHGPDAVLVGEVNAVPIEGFDLTNSPTLIMRRGRGLFEGRTVVHRTSAGTTGALAALGRAREVLLASYVNAGATARWILGRGAVEVSLVAMGDNAREPAPEDEGCADLIEHLLTGRPYSHVDTVASIIEHPNARKFLRGDRDYLPPGDPVVCLQRDLFDFTLRAVAAGDDVMAEKVSAGSG